MDGTNLFAHAWGPILRNHDFENLGNESDDIVVSSLAAVVGLTPVSPEFSGSLSYVASGSTDMYLTRQDRVLSGLIDSVELVHTSGSNISNSFSVFKLDRQFKTLADDPYMFNRTFISSRSTGNGLSRIRFDMAKYGQAPGSPVQDTFLLPDHKFKYTVKALATKSAGTSFGNNRQFGVWIHTKPEEGLMWSFVNDTWIQHNQLISKEKAIEYSKIFNFPNKTKEEVEEEEGLRLQCLDIVTGVSTPASPVSRIRESDFTNFDVEFDTQNRLLRLPKTYRDNHPQLHRKDQEYVIEVFLLPTGALDEFMIIDTVNLQDTTLKTMTEKFVGGKYQDPLCCLPYLRGRCEELRVKLTKEELMSVFRFFNDLAGKNSTPGYASRDSAITSTIMGTDGGSRTDHRTRTEWSVVGWVGAALSLRTAIDEITIII